MKKRIIGYWRTLKHNVAYVDGYFKKAMIISLLLLLADLVVLYFVW